MGGSWGAFWEVWRDLGTVLGGLGAPFGGSVALLGANMAEKTDKTAKKLVSLNVPHALGEEKWVQRGPKGAKKEPKSIQKVIKNRT